MKKSELEKLKLELAQKGRVSVVSEEIKKPVEEVKNVRYVYNPTPHLVRIASLNIYIRPGEFVDLVAVTGQPEKVYSDTGVKLLVDSGSLIGFSTLDELENVKLKKPETKTPVDKFKEEAGIVVTEEGTRVPVERITEEPNPFGEMLEEEYAKEEEEINKLEEVLARKKKKKKE